MNFAAPNMDLLQSEIWDAAIIGAGPAGAASAASLAGRGWRVLLLERSTWPREKVCGGCLNATAISLLRQMGLAGAIESAVPVHRINLRLGNRPIVLPLEQGAAISRKQLDQNLVNEVVRRGGVFVSGASATVLPVPENQNFREIAVRIDGEEKILRSRLVLACDGINGTSLHREKWAAWHVDQHSWFGASATLEDMQMNIAPGSIKMHVGDGGYVGMVRLPDRQIHLAAALSPQACRQAGGPGYLAATILRECGQVPVSAINDVKFHGTGLLTRRRHHLGGHRVLAVGDACGYVEPFTGEGMAWALRGAAEVVELLPDPGKNWPSDLPQRWEQQHHLNIQRQQRLCRAIRWGLRSPTLRSFGGAIIHGLPHLASQISVRLGCCGAMA